METSDRRQLAGGRDLVRELDVSSAPSDWTAPARFDTRRVRSTEARPAIESDILARADVLGQVMWIRSGRTMMSPVAT
jgi:hypothetical protein